MLIIKLLPPYDIIGIGTPAAGKIPVVMPAFILTCKKKKHELPNDVIFKNTLFT
jgi:hypothetical protein